MAIYLKIHHNDKNKTGGLRQVAESVLLQQTSIESRPIPADPTQKSFRHRGFHFLKKAGTNRLPLPQYMWHSRRDWLRYAESALIRQYPKLVTPSPKPDPFCYHYEAPVHNPKDFSFVLVGDTGMNSPGQYLVSSALSRQDLYPSEFCMILGDVMYPAGGQESYQYGLLEAFKHYQQPILALPGNHDWYDNLRAFRKFFVSGKIPNDLAGHYTWNSPKLPNWFYFMDIGQDLRIICLDSGITGEMIQNRKLQLTWLDHLLETAGQRKVILMMHHPLYSLNQRGHEPGLRKLIEPRLSKANVIAIFSGHDHNYQRHTLDSSVQQIIQGAGGASLRALPDYRQVHLPSGKKQILKKQAGWDEAFSFIHCHWQNGQLTCTTVSAHDLPGRVLDQFVL